MSSGIDVKGLPHGYLVHQAVLEIRYRDGVVYLDRCGSLMLDLQRALGDAFTANVPQMQYGELKSEEEWLTVRYGQASCSVTQVAPTTMARFQSVATTCWPVAGNKLGVMRKVERCGFRLWLVRTTDSKAESEELVQRADLFAPTSRWAQLFDSSQPTELSFAAMVPRSHGMLRIGISGTQHKVNGNAPQRILSASPPNAFQLDLDYTLDTSELSAKDGLGSFIRESWMHARELPNKLFPDA